MLDVLDWAGGGLDDFTGTYNGEHRVYEGWGGLSWSRSLSDSVGIGVAVNVGSGVSVGVLVGV